MKNIIFYLLFILFLSCEKQELSLCETNQTFILIFKNYQLSEGCGYIKYLNINNQIINVEYIFNELKYTVKTKEADQIYVITKNNKKEYIQRIPNACANYNFYW